jgi:hypothetical protein
MSGRVDPFAILKEPTAFATKPKPEKRADEAVIEDFARQNNFPSRQSPRPDAKPKRQQRRYRTGRNRHISIKATEETQGKFYKALDARGITTGELLRLALDALEREKTSNL